MLWPEILTIFYNLAVLPVGDANLAALIWTVILMYFVSRIGLGFDGALIAGAGFLLVFGATAFVSGGQVLYIAVLMGIGMLTFLGFVKFMR